MYQLHRIALLVVLTIALAACQPTPPPATVIVVVTATMAPPATSTPVSPAPTATSTPSPLVPTLTSTPVSPTPTPDLVPSPTAEVLSADEACATFSDGQLGRAEWSDPVDGCLKNLNANFQRGVTADGAPRYWSLTSRNGGVPVTCDNSGCLFRPAGVAHQARTLLTQQLSGIEPGQCYVAKLVWGYSLRSSDADAGRPLTIWPENLLFAVLQTGSVTNSQGFPRPATAPRPAEANRIVGAQEHVWPLVGGSNPTPTVSLGLQVQWGSLTPESSVTLLSAGVYAAPAGYCGGATLTF